MYQDRIKVLYEEANGLSVQAAERDKEFKALGDKAPEDWAKQVDDLITAAQSKIDAAQALEGEAKADAERQEKLAAQREQLSRSAGRLPGMANGGGQAKGAGWVDPADPDVKASPVAGTVLEVKGAYVGKTADDGTFHKLVPTEEFRKSRKLQAIATPEYKAAWDAYVRNRPYDAKALTEGVDSAGGYLVPADMMAEVITRLPGMAIVEERARIVQSSSDKVRVPRMKAATSDATMYSSAVSFTMVGETPTAGAGATEPAFEQVEIDIHTGVLETQLSKNLIADSAFDIEGLLSTEFRRAATLGRDDKHLTGNGVLAPVGIMNDADINYVATGNASAITAQGWKNLVHDLAAQYRTGAEIVLSRDCLLDTDSLVDGNGRYLLDAMNGGLAAGAAPTILGVPYRVTDFLDSVSASSKPAFYGNLAFYWAVIRAELAIQVLTEVFARQNEIGYLGFLRFGGAVSVPEAFRHLKVAAS